MLQSNESMKIPQNGISSLHTVCPYYTMFPLEFPLAALQSAPKKGSWVLDPFCGRGTTNYAARLLGLSSVGVDASPVAVAIAKAKLSHTTVDDVVSTARRILSANTDSADVPTGRFWTSCYNSGTLKSLCKLRNSLLSNCASQERIALRAIILGALHGPLTTGKPSYFSNQSPRTYAPKPAYAVRFWEKRGLVAPKVDVLETIATRARRYLSMQPAHSPGHIIQGDSRTPKSLANHRKYSHIVTSPPYYGMRTYLQDQWIRHWFVGGADRVNYTPSEKQVLHRSPETFANELRKVWNNAAAVSRPGAKLVVRFGAINDRNVHPLDILKESLRLTGWTIATTKQAGTATDGKRQAAQFQDANPISLMEYDLHARLS